MSMLPLNKKTESIAIAACALVGAVLRLWSLGSLGLVHFDEGIYALAASSLTVGSVDPGLIPYAPPGYPVLVAIAYGLLGVGDTPGLLVSIAASVATIGLVGAMSRHVFGPGAGLIAAILLAFSGPHIAFARTALTDSTSLLVWLLALAAGARFLDRPNVGRAVILGIGVAGAQYVKYSGWLAMAVVVLAALPRMVVIESRALLARLLVGLGVAGLTASLLYCPWYLFVESNGSYAGLMAHHRSYVQGPMAWTTNLRFQLDQVTALSGSFDLRGGWRIATTLLALLPGLAARSFNRTSIRGQRFLSGLGILAQLVEPAAAWWGAAMVLPNGLGRKDVWWRILAVGWVLLSLLTPLYHPYARLWLPLQTLSLIIVAGEMVIGSGEDRIGRVVIAWVGLVAFLALGHGATSTARPLPGLLGPSDSVRDAAIGIGEMTAGSPGVLVLARPSVLFYLAAKANVSRLPSAAALENAPNGPISWAVLDTVQLGQEGDVDAQLARILSGWEIVERHPITMNLPTRLDVHPASVSSDTPLPDDALILLRPRGAPR